MAKCNDCGRTAPMVRDGLCYDCREDRRLYGDEVVDAGKPIDRTERPAEKCEGCGIPLGGEMPEDASAEEMLCDRCHRQEEEATEATSGHHNHKGDRYES